MEHVGEAQIPKEIDILIGQGGTYRFFYPQASQISPINNGVSYIILLLLHKIRKQQNKIKEKDRKRNTRGLHFTNLSKTLYLTKGNACISHQVQNIQRGYDSLPLIRSVYNGDLPRHLVILHFTRTYSVPPLVLFTSSSLYIQQCPHTHGSLWVGIDLIWLI